MSWSLCQGLIWIRRNIIGLFKLWRLMFSGYKLLLYNTTTCSFTIFAVRRNSNDLLLLFILLSRYYKFLLSSFSYPQDPRRNKLIWKLQLAGHNCRLPESNPAPQTNYLSITPLPLGLLATKWKIERVQDVAMRLLKVPRSGVEPGIFLMFVYFLSQWQRLRPLGYCDPLVTMILKWEWTESESTLTPVPVLMSFVFLS